MRCCQQWQQNDEKYVRQQLKKLNPSVLVTSKGFNIRIVVTLVTDKQFGTIGLESISVKGLLLKNRQKDVSADIHLYICTAFKSASSRNGDCPASKP